MSGSTRVAVLDLGTNTTRLLVADVGEGQVGEVERHTRITGLGRGVDATGRLSDEGVARVLEAVADYRAMIDRLGAERVVALATSAVRDAANGEDFVRELHERFAIEARAIPGEEEGRLTFLGATSRRAPGAEPVMVMDIGGGSTEYMVGIPGSVPDFDVSTSAGSVRQTERHLQSDPPAHEETEALADEIVAIVEGEVPADFRERVDSGIAVAGTATSLAAISLELDPYDSERVDGFVLSLGEVERLTAMLATLPLDRRREVTGLDPDRAPTIVAGAVILLESIRAFGLDEIEVSEADILHGAALTAAGSDAAV
jgi:exopolyphosphatase / guanosine-5'-triphosphate,3'-diphosphate pyrophosphatase